MIIIILPFYPWQIGESNLKNISEKMSSQLKVFFHSDRWQLTFRQLCTFPAAKLLNTHFAQVLKTLTRTLRKKKVGEGENRGRNSQEPPRKVLEAQIINSVLGKFKYHPSLVGWCFCVLKTLICWWYLFMMSKAVSVQPRCIGRADCQPSKC